MKLTLKVWRQKGKTDNGKFETYQLEVNEHMSFLEMMDVLNEELIAKKEMPVAFEHDCREGICGACSMVINGRPHGPMDETTTCQLHMRSFKDGDTIYVEPWRAQAFPVHKAGIYAIAFDPSGKCATASRDKTAKLWDSATFDPLARLDRLAGGHSHSVNAVCWVGGTLLTGGDDRIIHAWTAS